MSLEFIAALSAIFVSIAGGIFNYYKLKDDQKTWEQEQKISIEKKLLFKRLKKRHKLYHKIFKLLGYIRDIEYPIEHHQNISKNKNKLAKVADSILIELYGKSGLFMEYKTRSLILKTYQTSYRYINNEVTLEELIDSYYYARRAIRHDLEFDDSKGNVAKDDILEVTASDAKEKNMKKEKEKVWVINNVLARSSRPGYPDKVVNLSILNKTITHWKSLGIKSIICLLSNEEIKMYYKVINSDLIKFYKDNGFIVYHINVIDFQSPPLNSSQLEEILIQYKKMEKPLLIHCGAGEDRTGVSIDYILSQNPDIKKLKQ